MYIDNKEGRVIIIPVFPGMKKARMRKAERVNMNSARQLLPGVNYIADSVYQQLKKIEIFAMKIGETIIEISKDEQQVKSARTTMDGWRKQKAAKLEEIEIVKENLEYETDPAKKGTYKKSKRDKEKEVADLDGKLAEKAKELDEISAGEFKKLSHEKKQELIEKTFNISLLEKWSGGEGAECRNMIDDRIKKIRKPNGDSGLSKPSGSIK